MLTLYNIMQLYWIIGLGFYDLEVKLSNVRVKSSQWIGIILKLQGSLISCFPSGTQSYYYLL